MAMKLRFLAVLAALAVPLAGCAVPSDGARPSAASTASPGAPLLGTEGLPAALLEHDQPTDCAQDPQRSEEGRGVELTIRIQGCIQANAQLPGFTLPNGDRVGGEPVGVGNINETVPVPEGAASLALLVHLHGREPMRVKLDNAAGTTVFNEMVRGGSTDTYVRLEYETPMPGDWHVEGEVHGNAVAREWSVVAVVDQAA